MKYPKKQKNKKINSQNSGFIVLLTVVIASIVLTMVMGISSIAVKQMTLTAGAKEGSRALFAADAGIECALYWDVNRKTTNNTSYFDSKNIPPQIINCGGNPYSIFAPFKITAPSPPSLTNTDYDSYQFDLNLSQGCAKVTVFKNYPLDTDPPPSGDNIIDITKELYTQVESRGYNVPCSSLLLNPLPSIMVERGIRTYY